MSSPQVREMDGFALIQWTKGNARTRDIPIVIYSGSASPEDAQRAYALGVNGYFAKLSGPGNLNLLFAAIRELCGES
jgi:CheY-like chemotaxis protein